jgi:hypothetical protein
VKLHRQIGLQHKHREKLWKFFENEPKTPQLRNFAPNSSVGYFGQFGLDARALGLHQQFVKCQPFLCF